MKKPSFTNEIYRRKLTFCKGAVLVLLMITLVHWAMKYVFKLHNQSNTDFNTFLNTDSIFSPPLTELEQYLGYAHIDFNIQRRFNIGKTSNGDSTVQGIPKLLHFIWTDDKIPSMFAVNLKSFRMNNPKWDIVFWTFENARNLILQKEPQLLNTFNGHEMNVVKADVIKYVVLFHYGGAYFDIDTRSIRPLDPFVEGKHCILSPERKENAIIFLQRSSVLASSMFICRAKHPLFRHFIDSLPFYNRERSIMAAAGPLFVTWNVISFIQRQTYYPTYERCLFDVVSSAYFEDHIAEKITVSFAKLCANNRRVNISSSTQQNELSRNYALKYWNKDLYTDPTVWIQIVQSSCDDWETRGGVLREPSPIAITEHVHYGTYVEKNQKELDNSDKFHIKAIIPDAKLYEKHLEI